jgi:hypothetical protein
MPFDNKIEQAPYGLLNYRLFSKSSLCLVWQAHMSMAEAAPS